MNNAAAGCEESKYMGKSMKNIRETVAFSCIITHPRTIKMLNKTIQSTE